MENFSENSLKDIINLLDLKKGKVVFYGKNFNGVLDFSVFYDLLYFGSIPFYVFLSFFHILSIYEMESYTICILAENK